MPMLIDCKDKPGHLQLRLDTRERHLAYLDKHKAKLMAGGAVLDQEGHPKGSVLIVDTDDVAEAQALADGDPYAQAGLFDSVTITPWRMVYFNFENRL
ncbi:MAG: YciI family protein [Alphaproteobacteria bacterium]|nr:YciI family protein [Alphaproteobacteria bacterium]